MILEENFTSGLLVIIKIKRNSQKIPYVMLMYCLQRLKLLLSLAFPLCPHQGIRQTASTHR